MRYFSIASIIIFYIFFFARAYLLQKKIGKTIKAKDKILNIAIFFAGLSSLIFVIQKVLFSIEKFYFILADTIVLEIIGTIFIFVGLLFSILSSLNLGHSWRIGINIEEKTSLITSGIYQISRNPYFLSYDLVLIGIILSSFSLLVIAPSIITISLFHSLILKEEKYLENIHGEIYREYRNKVRRYI